MKWINYHHLIYFKVIAQQGSISKASEILKVGQPALSAQLKNLEEYLGVKLFDRKNRKLHLTEQGKVALEYASQINYLGQELLHTMTTKGVAQNLQLRVGALDSIPKHLICDIVEFARKKTGCFLSIYEDSKESLIGKLLSHQIDLVITDHHVTSFGQNKLYCKKILNKKVMAHASKEFSDLKKNFPESLNGAPCIVPTSHSKLRGDLDRYFYENEVTPKLIAETQDTALQKILASKSEGVIFLPHFTTKELMADNKLIRIGQLKDVFSSYYLVHSEQRIENPAARLILDQNFEKMRLG